MPRRTPVGGSDRRQIIEVAMRLFSRQGFQGTKTRATLPVLNRARNVLFLAAGTEKKEVLQAIRNDPEGAARRYAAAMVRPARHVCWFLDQARG
jgi:6-phosphogluconolactonase/glucosamine-6-phosphate isomerase/deaminase